MTPDTWTTIDTYLASHLLPHDPALTATLAASDAANLPAISVSPTHGQFLHLLALTLNARHILEIGTLAGYSAICLGRALPSGGHLTTLEFNPINANIAQANITAAGLADRITIRTGLALDTLPKLAAEHLPPFDLTFIDADKVNGPNYLTWAIKLSRPGGLILIDNVIREGAILDEHSTDPAIPATRKLFEQVAADKRLTATALQTVGAKGYDGFLLARINHK